jgi:hypothetical protein
MPPAKAKRRTKPAKPQNPSKSDPEIKALKEDLEASGSITRESLLGILEQRITREDISSTEFYRIAGQITVLQGWNKTDESTDMESKERPDPAHLMDYLSTAAAMPAGEWLDGMGGLAEVLKLLCELGKTTPTAIVAAAWTIDCT